MDNRFFSLQDKQLTNEQLLDLGQAAQELLSSTAFQDFIRHHSTTLYDVFLEFTPIATQYQMSDVIHRQNVLSELVGHMRYLVQEMETIQTKSHTRRESNGSQDQKRRVEEDPNGERERILGISGDPSRQVQV